MDQGWGSFRITDGDVSVSDDTVRIHKTPKKFLHAQLSHWEDRSRWRQITAVVRIAGFLLLSLSIIQQVYNIFNMPVGLVAFFYFSVVAIEIYMVWKKHLRETRIPLSAIDDVTLDTDERELTITHDTERRSSVVDDNSSQRWSLRDSLSNFLEMNKTGTTMTLRTADDIRKVRTVFRTRGISEGVASKHEGTETETKYRVDTKKGVVFCGRCGSQVSPSDRDCPTCDYTLGVEQSAETNAQELLAEF
jgi:hypothetical protein